MALLRNMEFGYSSHLRSNYFARLAHIRFILACDNTVLVPQYSCTAVDVYNQDSSNAVLLYGVNDLGSYSCEWCWAIICNP